MLANVFLSLVPLILAAVFAVAAAAKSWSLARTRDSLAGFGVPTRLVSALAPALPLAEGAVAVLLLPFVAPRLGAGAALVLLTVFTGVIARSLSLGRAIECNCFGAVRPGPISRHTLVRNTLLLALAGVVAVFGPGALAARISAWIVGLSAVNQVLLAFPALTLGVLLWGGGLVLHLLRDQERQLREIEGRLVNVPRAAGLPVGAFAPGFTLPAVAPEDTELSLQSLLAPGKPLLLFFVHPDCGSCGALMPKILAWKAEHAERFRFALVTSKSEHSTHGPEYRQIDAGIEESWAVSKGYQVTAFPSAVLVRPDGTIGSPVSFGEAAIRNLIDWVTTR